MMKITNKKNEKGFTLMETIVAIGVVMIGIVSSLGVITTALSYFSNIQDKLIAANLVVEGVEVTRNIRDNNWLNNLAWNKGLDNGDYQAVYNSTSFSPYGGGNPLLFDSSTGLYNYTSGNPTYYFRRISIANLSSYEIRIISTVTWQKKGVTYSSSSEEHLFNWK